MFERLTTLFARTMAAAAIVAVASTAAAQSNIAVQFNFNDSTTNPSTNNTNGTPTATTIATTFTFDVGTGSSDPALPNMAWNTSDYPAAGVGSGTAGVRFNVPTSTAGGGFNNLFVRYDQQNSGPASRYSRFEYTTNGTTFVPFSTYATTLGDTFFTRAYDLSAVAAANNNANFAIRVVSVFDPAAGDYTATTSAGTAYATTGTVRFDMVTVSRGVNWIGGSGTNIDAAANYQGGVAPTAADTVAFGTSGNTTVNVNANTTFGQLAFRAGAPAYTFAAGGGTLTLDVGIVNDSAATQTFSAPVAIAGQRTIQNNGRLAFNGGLTMTGNTLLQLVGTGTTAINSTYTGNDINVTAGHTLAGIGTINNEVQIYTAKVRGGVADGTNNFGTLTVNVAGDLELYLAPGDRAPSFVVEATRTGVGTVNNSRIAITGGTGADLELNDAAVGGPNRFNIELLTTNLTVGESYTMTFLTTDSTGSIEFGNAPQANGAIIDPASYNLFSANYNFVGVQLQVVDVAAGSTLVLSFSPTPVPEPASVTLIGMAGLAVGGFLRRRTKRSEDGKLFPSPPGRCV